MRNLFLALVALSMALPASAETISIRNRVTDSIQTNVLGTSLNSPPTVLVIRSQRGAQYFVKRYSNYNNLSSYNKVYKLTKQLRAVDFNTKMVIAVVSQPMDNYQVKVKKIELDDGVLLVNATYRHERRNYEIPPKKSIYYSLAVVDKMSQPVLLEAKNLKVRSRASKTTKVTVTGRLMKFRDSTYQIVPVRIQRGKKHSYYIKTGNEGDLSRYVGKVITVAGSVSHEMDSPYEHNLQVDKLLKSK